LSNHKCNKEQQNILLEAREMVGFEVNAETTDRIRLLPEKKHKESQ
jgi:hypothetical protein